MSAFVCFLMLCRENGLLHPELQAAITDGFMPVATFVWCCRLRSCVYVCVCQEICPACSTRVYPMDKHVAVEGFLFHLSCFKVTLNAEGSHCHSPVLTGVFVTAWFSMPVILLWRM